MPASLSKSDFQVAQGCAKKLIYRKAKYPSATEANEFMELLAQGGYVVGKMATMLFEGGLEISGSREACLLETQSLLQNDLQVLFEAAFASGQKEARVDILVKEGKQLQLIEVKSKGFDSTAPFDEKKLGPLLDDIAFQYLIVSELYPDLDISCSLLMPDKAKRCEIDALPVWFPVVPPQPTGQPWAFRKPEVKFRFEDHPDREKYVDQLKEGGILGIVDVTDAVLARLPQIKENATRFVRILNEGISADDFRLGKQCKTCEFKAPGSEKDGFAECWGKAAYPQHSIFDLYHGTTLKHPDGGSYLDKLIEQGSSSMIDIVPEHLGNPHGAVGQRRKIQFEGTLSNCEWTSEDLIPILEDLKYPLHFIDFETYTGAVPFHKGMRPYELIAFQWSCHTIDAPGMAPRHQEWVHTGMDFPDPQAFPNFEFARSLMRAIGDTGTPLRWALHERTVMKTILAQMDSHGENDPELRAWLTKMASSSPDNWVDMQQLALKHYFHPSMKGSTSIKAVLPAVWNAHPRLHAMPFLKKYAPSAFLEGFHDPYDTLKGIQVPISEEDGEEEAVSGGTQAMRAYARIRFDEALSEAHKSEIRRQLLNYCELDTMAMVIIFLSWTGGGFPTQDEGKLD